VLTYYINKISRFKQILSRNTSITLDRMEMQVILRCTKDPLLPKKIGFICNGANSFCPELKASGAYIFRPNGTVPIKTDGQV